MRDEVNAEPLWRLALYWSTVVSFFTLPLFVLMLHLIFISYPELLHGHAVEHGGTGEFKYVFEFHRTLAALIFGLAGLHTGEVIVDRIKNGMPKAKAPEEPTTQDPTDK
jgi:hypothetical protein